ncbi:MAG: hypothetical protein ACTSXP_03780 [Promethearchaeota archaeon]
MKLTLEKIKKDIEAAYEIFQRQAIKINAFGENISIGEVTPLLAKYGYLFDDETLETADDWIARFMRAGDREMVEQVRRLKRQAIHYRGFISTITLYLSIQNLQASTILELDGGSRKISYRDAIKEIQNQDDRLKRNAIYQKYLEANERFVPYYRDIIWLIHQEAQDLNYNSFLDLIRDVDECDHDKLKVDMNKFLSKTTNIYRETLERLLETHLNLSLNAATAADILYLRRGKWLDNIGLDKKKMITSLDRVFRDMGYNWGENVTGLKLDLEDRPKKSPRACCITPKIPSEVYLICKPKGGFDDYKAYYHESGHAIHALTIDASLDITYRLLGDRSISEVVAFLYESLLEEQDFLSSILNLKRKDSDALVEFANFLKLQTMRSIAAKYLYELELYSRKPDDIDSMRKKYKNLLTTALLYEVSGVNYLAGDYGFYSSEYLRAWLFEVQIRNKLSEKFGVWWQSKDAGGYLKNNYLCFGSRYHLDALAKKWNANIHSVEPITDDFKNKLGKIGYR